MAAAAIIECLSFVETLSSTDDVTSRLKDLSFFKIAHKNTKLTVVDIAGACANTSDWVGDCVVAVVIQDLKTVPSFFKAAAWCTMWIGVAGDLSKLWFFYERRRLGDAISIMQNDQAAADVSQLATLLEDGPQVVLLVVLVLLYDAGEDLEGAGLVSILTSILNVLLKWWAANKEREAAPKKAYTLLLEDLTDSDNVRNICLRSTNWIPVN